MFHHVIRLCCVSAFIIGLLLPTAAIASPSYQQHTQPYSPGFPAADPSYIYDQLFYMVTHFQRREAGYDANLPVNVNGHDDFAAYCSDEILHDLQVFGLQVRRDTFPVKGRLTRPATIPAFNLDVTVPGI